MIQWKTVVSHLRNADRKCTFWKIGKLNELKNSLGRDPDQYEEAETRVVENLPSVFLGV